MSYKYENIGGKVSSYAFETDNGLVYEVKFKPTPYLFGDNLPEISNFIFELIIEVVYNPENKFPSVDKKIGETTAAIFIDFYKKYGQAVSIYVCDSSDGKQLIRQRKFSQWFYEFTDSDFCKIDEKLIDSNNQIYPITLTLSKSNPLRNEIFEAFINISEIHSK